MYGRVVSGGSVLSPECFLHRASAVAESRRICTGACPAFYRQGPKKLNKTIAGIEDRAVKAMQHYPWPGNIREMQNVIERSAVLVKDGVIRLENLPTIFTDTYESCHDEDVSRRRTSFKAERELQVGRTEKNIIVRYLEESDGNVAKAARLANLPRRTFYRLLEKHGIEVVRRSKSISS